MVEALHVEAEVLRARRARGAARDPGALVRREDPVRGAGFLELGEPLVLGDLGLAVEGGVGRLLRLRVSGRARIAGRMRQQYGQEEPHTETVRV